MAEFDLLNGHEMSVSKKYSEIRELIDNGIPNYTASENLSVTNDGRIMIALKRAEEVAV